MNILVDWFMILQLHIHLLFYTVTFLRNWLLLLNFLSIWCCIFERQQPKRHYLWNRFPNKSTSSTFLDPRFRQISLRSSLNGRCSTRESNKHCRPEEVLIWIAPFGSALVSECLIIYMLLLHHPGVLVTLFSLHASVYCCAIQPSAMSSCCW